MAVANEVLKLDEHNPILQALKLAKTDANNMAQERNDIIHGDYHYSFDEGSPFVALADPNTQWSIALSSGSDWRK